MIKQHTKAFLKTLHIIYQRYKKLFCKEIFLHCPVLQPTDLNFVSGFIRQNTIQKHASRNYKEIRLRAVQQIRPIVVVSTYN